MSNDADKFWEEILPDIRAALEITPSDLCEKMARTYINSLEWSDQATDHEKALVAGNINSFAQGVLRPMMIVKDKHIENLKEERDETKVLLTAAQDQIEWMKKKALNRRHPNHDLHDRD